jgi:branched-chain amino acid aminotransferase
MTCTRGRIAAGSRDIRTAQNTFYCFAVPFVWISSPGQQATGASMRISQVTRIPSQSIDPSVKNYHWLDMEMAQLDAYDHEAQLVVLRDLSGAITEGPGFNVFAYVDGRWLTPASGTLQGITRRSVIELAGQVGEPAEEGRLSAEDLRRAAEVLVTSTAGGIMPVTVIDGEPVGTGAPGPLTTLLRELYWDRHLAALVAVSVRDGRAGGPKEPRRWSWYLPLASSSRVWSSRIMYCSAALFTPTATMVRPLAFFSWHSRAMQ